jgi:hypothetical protein
MLILLSEVSSYDISSPVLFYLLFFFYPLGIPGACSQSLLESLLLEDPVIHEIEVKALSDEELSEHGYYLLVVRSLLKLKLSGVVQVLLKLLWIP